MTDAPGRHDGAATMTARNPLPPGWPSPERVAVIMEAIGRDIERYRAEFEKRERAKNENT